MKFCELRLYGVLRSPYARAYSGCAVGETEDSFACEGCVEVLGGYRPDRFPTIEEYRRLEAEWGTPEYASIEELERAVGIW